MLELFHQSSFLCSRKVTELYSTSFTLGIRALDNRFHDAIYGIYGFVRYADEIVDTFHDWDKSALLARFKADTYEAIDQKISLNPILHAFQLTVHKYQIDNKLIDAFLHSMEMDLFTQNYKYEGIKMLPEGAKFGVYLAYKYYLNLFKKIRKTDAEKVLHTRIRVSNPKKIGIWASVYLRSNVLGIYAP
ncbi:MAG: squalene/phytoene synthase family protein [Bacteroidetes bacterium]|nr:squalene/phytoene synthase family protein [Bacteroidota bacterium]